MLPMPTLWWLRPVRSAARVGEQSAVVWNSLYLRPLLAKRSSVGVGIGPPKALAAPKPVSSVMISKTLGARFGAVTSLGKSAVDSLALRPMTPPNWGWGTGSTAEPRVGPEGDGCCASAAGQFVARAIANKQTMDESERNAEIATRRRFIESPPTRAHFVIATRISRPRPTECFTKRD